MDYLLHFEVCADKFTASAGAYALTEGKPPYYARDFSALYLYGMMNRIRSRKKRVTCWRRLDQWTRAGVWPRVHARLLRALASEGQLDARLGIVDSQSMRAVLGGRTLVRTPRIGAREAASGT